MASIVCVKTSYAAAFQEYSVEFSSYFNVMWREPRLYIPESFTREINATEPDTMVPVNLELVNHLWLPNVFIYNLRTFKVKQPKAYALRWKNNSKLKTKLGQI